ncbi:hypothetical protein BRADI_3g16490v3 [Brachypodium distachyon]|uniref:Uncharacterized protein n=1 Tax=Brachypodium distachyon TaxID=15368 RepID=A0A0Q3JAM1_BRADI|nr:hypothetical protein BRADI_3g16490v3 [Brachypodium distachyon]
MTPATATAAAIDSALSPHAAPFTLPYRSACAPPGLLQDGDVSSSTDGSFVVCAEEKKARDPQSASCLLTKSSGTVYPPSTYGMQAGQLSSWPGLCVDAYGSSTSVRITSSYEQQSSLISGNRSKCSTVKIERPPNKTSDTNNASCGPRSKLVIAENPKSKDTGKEISFTRTLQVKNPVDGKDNSQGTIICSKVENPVFNGKPLCIPTTSANPCSFVADDVKPDPSDCSVDSPCWKGASASRQSPFDVRQTPAPQSANQELEAVSAGQKQSSSTFQHYEAPVELQISASSKTKHDHSQSYPEVSVSMKSRGISIEQTKDSHGKERECADQCAAKSETKQKHLLVLRDNHVKRSSLNSAAPDFVPSSIGKPKIGKGPCSSTGRSISGVLKAIENLTEVFQSSYSEDGIELEEHDYIILESVISNLQNCLHKKRKGPIDAASDKAGLKAPHPQTTVLKSDAGKYNGSYVADDGKGLIIDRFTGSSHMINDFGRSSLTRGQPSLNNVPKKISAEEEHPQVLVYKNLWIEAERANSSLAHPPMLSFHKQQPAGETSGSSSSQNLIYPGDCILSGGNSALSCSPSTKRYSTLQKNLQRGHVLTGQEETITHHNAHSGLQPAPNRARQELNGSTLDGASSRSYIGRRDDIFLGNSEYGSSDWEHVLTEEIGWS